MTSYIAAYDAESVECLPACRRIVEVHRQMGVPATFFIVGKRLEEHPREWRALLDDPLFEVASHTYSHRMLRDNPFCGPAVSAEARREEIAQGKAWVERAFERPCRGLRPGCGWPDGFRGAPDVLRLIQEAGLEYVSSALWGLDFTMPAPLRDPSRYEADGFPDLWELPAHGWHDNLLKDNNDMGPARLTLWPCDLAWGVPTDFVRTAEGEFAVNRLFIDHAVAEGRAYASLIWHPWSLARMDPEMRMLELTFAYVRRQGLETITFADLLDRLHGEGTRP